MFAVLVIFVVIVALILIGVVLVQNSSFDKYKKWFGPRRSVNLVERLTWFLAVIIILGCIVIACVL